MINIKYILLAGVVGVFVGCSTALPTVDLNKKELKTIDGKQYMIPVNASTSSYAVDAKVIKRYQEFGVSDCKEGDVTWEDYKTANAVNDVMRNGKKEEGIAIYKKAATEGRIGCASPVIK